MSNTYNKMHPVEEFTRHFLRVYLEERDFETVKSALHENVSWYGTGAHEICRNLSDAYRLLDAERDAQWDGRFKITKQSYNVNDIDDNTFLVMCEIEAVEDGLNTILMEMESRISLVFVRSNNGFKLLHLHFSVPNAAQESGEFIHKNMTANYDKLLEEKLIERTKLLKEKTKELEMLTDNVCGGLQICNDDEYYTITYISAGFKKLTGYSIEEINRLHQGRHMEIVHKVDAERVKKEVEAQLQKNGQISVEYRILHKDGHYIWVLDKGTRINSLNGQKRLQCILTDISAQKEQENLLRMSEKRYEAAILMSDMVMFEYNIVTRQLILYDRDSKLYNVGSVVENGMETFISKGIIEPDSVGDYREMYRKIHAGAESASSYVHAKDAMGNIHEYELSLHTVFDVDGVPQRAVGVRKNISQMRKLQREQEFSKALVLDKNYIYEANLTDNSIVWMSEYYLDALDADMSVSYSELMQIICDKFVSPEWHDTILSKTSCEYIERKYKNGERLVLFSYKRKNELGEYVWFEATISIMFDELSQNLHIRFYNNNINERKEKEYRAMEERKIYETMTSKATLAYEVNISRNKAIKGHENWAQDYGIEKSDNYSEMILAFSQRGIYAEDGPTFASTFNRDRLANEYIQGTHQVSCQYRKPNELGELRWVCCTLHMYEDPETGDIKGYSYVEDINEQKRGELELKYNAEHDTMTGLLNKYTAEKIADEFLESQLLTPHQHALLMIDIDFFKTVNDTFGHMFGDKVLREIAQKLKTLFRDEDIIGRIGGDEFIVLMKNVTTQDVVVSKANEICRRLVHEYIDNSHNAAISASVGVAIFPHDGTTYEELNRHADDALYNAKRGGKNGYRL